ncbi:rhomboid-like protein [Catenulispora subtropica]|uniref:Membrane protein n=1 Tax=Catenulispora subtropica TaxID=450798 RepID=A0ABN2RQN4_9ACTN
MVKRAARGVWTYVHSAPGTFIWLLILLITTAVLRHVDAHAAHWILERRSTNIHYLTQNPLRVLVQSALWIDGSSWLSYVVLYTIFHAQAERWLGTVRWLGVAVLCHVVATYVSEGVLALAIRKGLAPESKRFTLDYGVSYALAGVVAALTYWWPRGWMRWVYGGAVLLFYGAAMVLGKTFTDVGHFSAALVGLGCWPIVRVRASPMAWGFRWRALVGEPSAVGGGYSGSVGRAVGR